jgi:hypothetical protein
MNVEIRAEAALFPEKEYINGIAVAVHFDSTLPLTNFSLSKSVCRVLFVQNGRYDILSELADEGGGLSIQFQQRQ